jgi:hypothetical protein
VNESMSTSRHLRRRVIAAALAIPALLAVAPATATAAQGHGDRTVPLRVCHYDWRASTHQLKSVIRCAAHRWKVPGGVAKALSVARCESGFNPRAYNASGYAGVYQHAVRYWRQRADEWGFPRRSVFNGRANVIVAIRMAHALGWSAWGCA